MLTFAFSDDQVPAKLLFSMPCSTLLQPWMSAAQPLATEKYTVPLENPCLLAQVVTMLAILNYNLLFFLRVSEYQSSARSHTDD
jgi:hypothetical protein